MQAINLAHAMADAAFEAWLKVEERSDRHDKVGVGAGGNATSKADDALEKAILREAKARRVDVLSEEAGFVANKGKWLAIVDPLDGSRNAGRGIPFHCTSVAIAKAGAKGLKALHAGVVRNLVTGDTYWAAKGQGAWLNGQRVKARAFDPEEVLVGLIADYASTEIDEAHQRRDHHIRDLGSAALEMCLVGTGALDAFVVRRPWLRVIDIAAATLFVREAGGQVLDPDSRRDLDTAFDMEVRTGVLAAHGEDALSAVGGGVVPGKVRGKVVAAQSPDGKAMSGRSRAGAGAARRMTWAIVGNGSSPPIKKEAAWVAKYLRKRGQDVLLEDSLAGARGGHALSDLDKKADLFVTVGGDGTILMTQAVTDKPVLGVNAGAIGFMCEVEPPHAGSAIDQIIRGEYRVEERDKLSAWLDDEKLPDATNEVTLQTSRIAKLIQFRIKVSGEVLDTIRGDGVIVSTATGSTGYAMSVGGPLVHPLVHGTVLAPIAPFRLAARPWVVPSDAVVELTLLERDPREAKGKKEAQVVVDGQNGFSIAPGSTVRIAPSTRKARFVRLGSGYYERVRTKLTR